MGRSKQRIGERRRFLERRSREMIGVAREDEQSKQYPHEKRIVQEEEKTGVRRGYNQSGEQWKE